MIFHLPKLDVKIWILALGRLLLQIGTGLTLFSASIFFVNQVGLSATAVGIGLGSGSLSGILGRLLGGSCCDSSFWGRRRTLANILFTIYISQLQSTLPLYLKKSPGHDGFSDTFLSLLFSWHILFTVLALAIVTYTPLASALVVKLSPPEQRGVYLAMNSQCWAIGYLIGPPLGGRILDLGSLRSQEEKEWSSCISQKCKN